ncbi:MAG: hypothetical protein ACLFQY_15445, partial [Desulfococcaceae bacterium]
LYWYQRLHLLFHLAEAHTNRSAVKEIHMTQDPFGNLTDWGPALNTLEIMADRGRLEECQPGLIRILRYKGNWRLREEVLKRTGEIQKPIRELVFQVLAIIADDNLYYDVRILAADALSKLIHKIRNGDSDKIYPEMQAVIQKIRRTPQPPFFSRALEKLHSEFPDQNSREN